MFCVCVCMCVVWPFVGPVYCRKVEKDHCVFVTSQLFDNSLLHICACPDAKSANYVKEHISINVRLI